MKIRPKILLTYGRINEPIRVPIYDLLVDPVAETFVISDTASASGTLTVKNIAGFAVNQILFIGEVGSESSEIIKTHATTVPTGTTITLASNTVSNHSAGTRVRVMAFDQVEISSAPTTTGVKTVLVTPAINSGSIETRYNDTVTTTGYYFARFKNSITSVFSEYSDPAPLTGYTVMSARSVIDNALSMINKSIGDVLTDEFFFSQINNCQMETLREFKRWSFMQSFNMIIGQTSTGGWKVALPADCDDQNTTKSIYKIRIGKELQLIWIDKEDWNDLVGDIAATTLKIAISVGDVVISLTSSNDFTDQGTVSIGANQYVYSANNRTLDQLTIAASGTTNAVGDDVFQNSFTGNPAYFTTYGGWIYFWPIVNSVYNERNIYLDYYKSLIPITSDADQIVLPDPTIVQYYLAWKALLKLNNGETNAASEGMFSQYLLRREKCKMKESLNREFYLLPDSDYL